MYEGLGLLVNLKHNETRFDITLYIYKSTAKGGIYMSLASIGVPGLIIILVIILILFGPRKLPEIGSAVGKTLSEFKKATSDILEDDSKDKKTDSEKSESIK